MCIPMERENVEHVNVRAGLNGVEGDTQKIRKGNLASLFELLWDDVAPRCPEERFRLYRLCPGDTEPELIATCGTPEAVGVALVTLGREGQWDPLSGDCAVGILDTEGETGRKWIIRPWLASPKNMSDAGRVLRTGRQDVRRMTDEQRFIEKMIAYNVKERKERSK